MTMAFDSLLGLEGPWLHLLAASASQLCDTTWALQANVSRRVAARVVRGAKCQTVQGLFDEFAAALQFPYYFGENWDALEECLADLEWLPADAYVLCLSDAPLLLREAPAEQFALLLDLLVGVAGEWADPAPEGQPARPSRPFHVILHAVPGEAEALRRRVEAAGVDWESLPELRAGH